MKHWENGRFAPLAPLPNLSPIDIWIFRRKYKYGVKSLINKDCFNYTRMKKAVLRLKCFSKDYTWFLYYNQTLFKYRLKKGNELSSITTIYNSELLFKLLWEGQEYPCRRPPAFQRCLPPPFTLEWGQTPIP